MSPPEGSSRQRWGGHGDFGRRGRFSFARDPARAAVSASAARLLRLGRVRAETHLLRWRGVRLAYLEAGSGPPVVLLHGAGGGAANWFAVLARLARTHRVIAPDLPGFGLSEALPLDGPLSEAAVPAVEAVLEAAGMSRGDVCGTSFGALVALRLARATPRRVRRMVLIDTAGLGPEMPRSLRLAALPLLGRAILARPGARGIRWELRRLVTSTRLPPEREAALVAYLTACARAGDRAWFARILRRFVRRDGQAEIVSDEDLADVCQPTLVVWGARDRFFPVRHGQRAAAAIPRSILRVLPDVGHSPNWEHPEEIGALLEGFFAP